MRKFDTQANRIADAMDVLPWADVVYPSPPTIFPSPRAPVTVILRALTVVLRPVADQALLASASISLLFVAARQRGVREPGRRVFSEGLSSHNSLRREG
jgi:hypothetical protein